MKKVIIGIIAAALLITGAVFVIAQKAGRKDGPGFGHGHGSGFALALRGLDLTDEQKAKVKEIMDASKASVEPLMQQMRDNHAKIAALGTDGKFDQPQVEALAHLQGSITSQMILEREKVKAQVFAILTDEQKAKAAEMRTKFEERITDHKGFGGKRGGAEF
ncbi:MAG: Spy/CpxP family protein refolding chaperone [Acidobacteriota bacterium]